MKKFIVIKKSKISGKGVFAAKNFKRGDIVLKWYPKILNKSEFHGLSEKEKHFIEKNNGKILLMQAPERYVNHSCDPNTKSKNNCDIAIRDIENGEEITTSYNFDDDECKCGSLKCEFDTKIIIVPTILTRNFADFKKRLRQVEPFLKLAQIDCTDGKFVRNRTFFDKSKVQSLKSKVRYELHLMIKDPLKEIKKWVGFKKVKSIIFHYEAVKDDKEILGIINYLHKKGIRAGLAINLETKVEKVIKILPKLDVLLVMGVNPGWGGQKISLKVVKSKVYKVRKIFPKLDIEVDGGVNLKNAKEIIKAGANVLAMGKSLNSEKSINKLKYLVNRIK